MLKWLKCFNPFRSLESKIYSLIIKNAFNVENIEYQDNRIIIHQDLEIVVKGKIIIKSEDNITIQCGNDGRKYTNIIELNPSLEEEYGNSEYVERSEPRSLKQPDL